MRWIVGPTLTLAAVLAAAGCVTDTREWMKVSEKYTTEEFRRDHAVCSKSGKLDDSCMHARGWVAVNPGVKTETPKDPHARDVGVPARGRPPGY